MLTKVNLNFQGGANEIFHSQANEASIETAGAKANEFPRVEVYTDIDGDPAIFTHIETSPQSRSPALPDLYTPPESIASSIADSPAPGMKSRFLSHF